MKTAMMKMVICAAMVTCANTVTLAAEAAGGAEGNAKVVTSNAT